MENSYIEDYDWDDGAYIMLRYVMDNDLSISELLQIFFDGDGYSYLTYGRNDVEILEKKLMRFDFMLLLSFLSDEIEKKYSEINSLDDIDVKYGMTKVEKYKIRKRNVGIPDVFLDFN